MIFVENIPLHVQIKKDILNRIEKGEYQPGKRIPSERALADIYGVSRVTVRQAIDELLQRGVLLKKPGSGTYVKVLSIEQPMARLYGIIEELNQKNIEATFEVLRREFIPFTEENKKIWEQLNLSENSKVYFLERRLCADHRPFLLDYNYVSDDMGMKFETLDCQKDIIFQALEHFGYEISYAQQNLSAKCPDAYQREKLHLERDEAVLWVDRVIYNSQDCPLMFTTAVFAGNRYSYQVKLMRNR